LNATVPWHLASRIMQVSALLPFKDVAHRNPRGLPIRTASRVMLLPSNVRIIDL
jgi:hypothetical protein